MTVCIAAICKFENLYMIVGASDRMLTAGDIEFEPPQSKIFLLSHYPHHFVGLTAGEASAQATICTDTLNRVVTNQITNVGEVAQEYGRHFSEYRRTQAERRLLAPLGLNMDALINHNHNLPQECVTRLIHELREEQIGAEAIITGVDQSGAHIYVIRDPGHVFCHDSVAFSAIGIGAEHAGSQFMFARYTMEWTFPRAMLLTYYAKKRAEVAPGVGLETDMFCIVPGLPSPFQPFPQNIIQVLDGIYQQFRTEEQSVINAAYAGVEQYVQQLLQQQPQTAPSSNQEVAPEGAEEDQPSTQA